MSSRIARLILLLAATILGISLLAVLTVKADKGGVARSVSKETARLSSFLEPYPPPIKVKQINTETLRRLLGANQIIYIRCSEGNISHELYVAYWAAGNEYAYEATGHPPDICWPGSGWQMSDGRSNTVVDAGGVMLGPLEWRMFSAPNQDTQEVIYWCLNGTRLVSMLRQSEVAVTDPGNILKNSSFLKFWTGRETFLTDRSPISISSPSKHDVYFIRINTSHKIHEVLRSSALKIQLARLKHSGLIPNRD